MIAFPEILSHSRKLKDPLSNFIQLYYNTKTKNDDSIPDIISVDMLKIM